MSRGAGEPCHDLQRLDLRERRASGGLSLQPCGDDRRASCCRWLLLWSRRSSSVPESRCSLGEPCHDLQRLDLRERRASGGLSLQPCGDDRRASCCRWLLLWSRRSSSVPESRCSLGEPCHDLQRLDLRERRASGGASLQPCGDDRRALCCRWLLLWSRRSSSVPESRCSLPRPPRAASCTKGGSGNGPIRSLSSTSNLLLGHSKGEQDFSRETVTSSKGAQDALEELRNLRTQSPTEGVVVLCR